MPASEKVKLAIAEATQAFQLADAAAHSLYKTLCAENPLAAHLFLQTLKESAALRNQLEAMQAIVNEK